MNKTLIRNKEYDTETLNLIKKGLDEGYKGKDIIARFNLTYKTLTYIKEHFNIKKSTGEEYKTYTIKYKPMPLELKLKPACAAEPKATRKYITSEATRVKAKVYRDKYKARAAAELEPKDDTSITTDISEAKERVEEVMNYLLEDANTCAIDSMDMILGEVDKGIDASIKHDENIATIMKRLNKNKKKK